MDGRWSVPAQLRRGSDSAVLLASWWIWKERNSCTFDNSSSTVQQVTWLVLDEMDGWINTGFLAIAKFLVVPAAA
jgi:hypothetical protein